MMTRLLALAMTALAATACTNEAAPPATPDNSATAPAAEPAAAPSAAVPSLEGKWDATMFDGKPRAQPFAMTLTMAGGKVTLTSECVTRLFSYTQDRNLVSFTPLPGGTQCGRGLTANESGAGNALKNGTMAIFDADGATVTISGSGGNLTLQRR